MTQAPQQPAELHRRHLEDSDDAIITQDLQGVVTSWDGGAQRIFGYDADEIVGRSIRRILPPDRYSDEPEIAARMRRGEWINRHDTVWMHKNGARVHVSLNLFPIRSETGEVAGSVQIARDVSEHKRVRNALRNSEACYRARLDDAADAITLHDEQGRIVDVNQHACESLGYTRDELIGLTPDQFDADARPAFGSGIAARLAAGEIVAFESRHRRKDGSVFPVEVRIRPIQIGDQRRSLAIARDITARNQADDALPLGEERFRRYFESGLVGMAITSPDMRLIEINDELCRILGYARHELLSKAWSEMTHPDDLPTEIALCNRVMAVEIDGYSRDKRWYRKDGRIVDSNISVKCVRRADGSVDYFVAVVQDIADRKAAEDALRKSEFRQRSALERAGIGNWEVSLGDGKFVGNNVFGHLFGTLFAGPSVRAARVLKCIHPDDRALVSSGFREAVAKREDFSCEFRIILPDGGVRWHRVVGHVDCNVGGDPVRVFGIGIDITVRKVAEAVSRAAINRLAVAQEEQRRRIARDLHDRLGQQVAAVQLHLKSIESSLIPSSPGGVPLREALEMVEHLSREIVSISAEVRPALLDDLGLVPALRRQFAIWSARHHIEVDLVASSDVERRYPIETETAIYRIAQEALANVARHAGASSVSVILKEIDGEWKLIIEDNGCGFNVRDVQNGPIDGRLGLVGMSERIAQIGGSLQIESSLESGTTVIVCAPVPLGSAAKTGNSR